MPKRDEKRGRRGFAASVSLGVPLGFIVTFALFMIASSLILSGKLPESAMKTLTAAAAFIGSVVGSVAAVKRRGARRLATGLINGAVMFLIMLAGTLISNGSGAAQGLTVLLFLMSILGGALGALFCLRRKKHKRA